MSELVQLSEITKVYQGGVTGALNGVSLTVEEGEFTAVMGPSGSGKSTMLNPNLTALENVLIPAQLKSTSSAEARGRELLDELGIGEVADRYPARLSGGQQQRVAIARALINQPTLLLADEPTGALDTRSGDQVMELLMEVHRRGQTILLVTHDAKLATRYAARVISVLDGKIVDDARLETAERAATDVIRVRGEETRR